MKKALWFIIPILFIIGLFIGIFVYNKFSSSSSNNSNYNSTKVSTKSDNSTNNTSDNNTNDADNTQTNSSVNTTPTEPTTETLISEFSTKIYSKDEERQNNVSITCNTLNDTIVENCTEFSFCNTVGKATTSKGYQKADVYKDGKLVKALGGGNCQVSTTLYNAVLNVSGLTVTERHAHSNSVPYIKSGKDAAVSTGSYDFKFKNNTGNNIKINASTDGSFVYIKILKLE